MTRASQVVRQLGGPDPLAGFELSTVLKYRLPDDVEPVGQNGETDRKSVASQIVRLDREEKRIAKKNGRFPSRERTACEPFRLQLQGSLFTH
jgi:hypothetical protein